MRARSGGPSPSPSPLMGRHQSRRVSPSPSVASNTTADIYTDDVFVSGAEDSDVSLDMSGSSKSGSRKRGRPPTTGDYVGLAAAKLRVVEADRRLADLEEKRNILDPCTPLPPKIRETAEETVEHYLEELKNAPTGDILSQAFQDVEQVLRVSSVSKGLKGTLAKALKTSACRVRAGVTILSTRNITTAGEGQGSELLILSKELEQARREIKNLREEVKALRGRASELPTSRTSPPISPVVSGRGKSPNRKSRIIPDSPPRSEGAEEAMMSRLDSLFERWLRRKFGDSAPLPPQAKGKSRDPSASKKGAEKRAEVQTSKKRKPKGGKQSKANKGETDTDVSLMPPPSTPLPPRKSRRTASQSSASRATSAPAEAWAKVVGRKRGERGQVFGQSHVATSTQEERRYAKSPPKRDLQDAGETANRRNRLQRRRRGRGRRGSRRTPRPLLSPALRADTRRSSSSPSLR
ncbi:hypothetical protein PUN28_020712 [Cardiocondyla obscurior]|uniref:Uncharacterized protein n=1 Tax=Cardiocondyla obscurior TaxID=286306 RepID=A0AAW2E8X3_9HYME